MPAYIATSKNSIITFTSVLTGPPKLLTGFANDYIMEVPDVDIVKTTMGCDSFLNRAVIAKKTEGSFNFWAGSPAITFIYRLQQAVYNTGFVVNGTLNVVIPSLAVYFTYPDFCFESGPKGFELADEVKPIKIKWSSQLPNYASLGAAAAGIIGNFG
jgi:hypothetical protein